MLFQLQPIRDGVEVLDYSLFLPNSLAFDPDESWPWVTLIVCSDCFVPFVSFLKKWSQKVLKLQGQIRKPWSNRAMKQTVQVMWRPKKIPLCLISTNLTRSGFNETLEISTIQSWKILRTNLHLFVFFNRTWITTPPPHKQRWTRKSGGRKNCK